MNAVDVLYFGHMTVLRSLEGVPFSEWNRPGVCGVWSVRDIIAHLASYEHLLVESLQTLLGEGEMPTLNRLAEHGAHFNDYEVGRRQHLTPAEALAEYSDTCEQALALARRIPAATFRRNGAVAWYGTEYDLDDFITYTFYGHKREHMAQVDYFRDHVM